MAFKLFRWSDGVGAFASVLAIGALTVGFVLFDGEIPIRTPALEKSSVVLIDTERAQGSGVVIYRVNPREHLFVWTANHVISGATNVTVKQYFHWAGHRSGEMSFPAKVLKAYPAIDCALLIVDAPPALFKFAEWSDRVPKVGDSVVHIGNILGENFDRSYVPGVVSQVGVHPPSVEDWPWPNVDQIIAGVTSGCSGGPLFYGDEVIGLVVGKGPPGSILGFYVPERVISAAAERWMLFGHRCPPDSVLDKMITDSKPPAPTMPLLNIVIPH